eukprot:gene26530-53656_t
MRKATEWGDHVCLQAWADFKGGSVVVHFKGQAPRVIESPLAAGGPAYHVMFSGRADKGHYTALTRHQTDSEDDAEPEPERKPVKRPEQEPDN